MSDKPMGAVVTPEFRVSWPHLIKPYVVEGNEPKFRIEMLFDKETDISALHKLLNEAAKDKWGNKIPKNLKTPITDGDTLDKEIYHGKVRVRANKKTPPQVFDEQKTPVNIDGIIYAGCYARAKISAYAYDTAANKGIKFTLLAVQKTRDGEKFGVSDHTDDFDVVGNDDSIPF